ncbi:MAG: TPM domain-containing protein [Paludibacteraceae bacterium]
MLVNSLKTLRVRTFLFYIFLALGVSFNSCKKVSSTARIFFPQDTTEVIFPAPLGTISDFEEILTPEQIRSLDSLIVTHEYNTKNKISLVTIYSIHPYTTFSEYGIDLHEAWKKNDDKGNSVFILYSKKMGEIYIVAGKNLKKRLTDKDIKRICTKNMEPEFEKGEYYAGLKKGLQKIISEIR